jgi:hypothetical protein
VAGLTLGQVLPLALIFALINTVLALRASASPRIVWPPSGELGLFAAIALLTWLLAVAPALLTDRLMPLGYGMDVEFYMGLAAYLQDYSYPTLSQAPPNPIRNLLSSAYIGNIAFGATYVQGMADLIGGWEAWTSWVSMQASLRILMLCGLYALLRGALAVSAPGALLGLFLVSLNSHLLWLTYNNFSASLAGLAVLLAALAVTLAALEQGQPSLLLISGLLIGGLACLYWPLLTAFGALGAGLGLSAWYTSQQRRTVVLRGVALLSLGALVGFLPNLRAPQAFPGLFAATTAYMGIDAYVLRPRGTTTRCSSPLRWFSLA